MNFFAANYLIEGKVAKHYKNFISSAYALNEINDHNFRIQDILSLPYPIYNDYINYQIIEKRKELQKRKQEMALSMKK